MHKNITFSLGNIALIDKIDSETRFFESVLEPISGRSKSFIPAVKLLISNKLNQSVSINKLLEFTPDELLKTLGFEDRISERSLYRVLERIGDGYPFVLERFQQWILHQNLVDPTQFVDFSSSYFEGTQCPLGKRGYSRDNQPGKLQLTFGISVGLNNIPTMLTIQKGNVQDKPHMRSAIQLCSKVLPKESLLVFDCGGNTRDNKRRIRELEFHYLTLKAKKKGPYRKDIALYHARRDDRVSFVSNDQAYSCVKYRDGDEIRYIYFSENLAHTQMATKETKLEKDLKKGTILSKKVKCGKDIGQYIAPDGWIIARGHLQQIFGEHSNPYVTGIEGFFILESSVDDNPEQILTAYKNRDRAEKFIRDLKEGAELRPIRHWSKLMVIGHVVIVFLTKVVVSLTQYFSDNPVVKNLKVLKNYLTNLTLTIVYPSFGYGIRIISNYSPELRVILGDFVKRYGNLEAPNRW
jgi:transposase